MKLSRELSQLCWQDVKHYVQHEGFGMYCPRDLPKVNSNHKMNTKMTKKLLTLVFMLIAMGLTTTTFTSCDEETTKEFLTDLYLAQADHYVVKQAKRVEAGEYVAWEDFFDTKELAVETTFKFFSQNLSCELKGYFAPGDLPCTFSAKGDYVTIYADGKEYLRLTLLQTKSDLLEAKVYNVQTGKTLWVMMDRILK